MYSLTPISRETLMYILVNRMYSKTNGYHDWYYDIVNVNDPGYHLLKSYEVEQATEQVWLCLFNSDESLRVYVCGLKPDEFVAFNRRILCDLNNDNAHACNEKFLHKDCNQPFMQTAHILYWLTTLLPQYENENTAGVASMPVFTLTQVEMQEVDEPMSEIMSHQGISDCTPNLKRHTDEQCGGGGKRHKSSEHPDTPLD